MVPEHPVYRINAGATMQLIMMSRSRAGKKWFRLSNTGFYRVELMIINRAGNCYKIIEHYISTKEDPLF